MTAQGERSRTEPGKISVIVPVHNGSATLARCLEAIASSDHPRHECIVVDDASTDDTAAIAGRFPVRVIPLAGGPSGPARARNRGAKEAEGEILFFVDADVVIRPDTLSKVADAFARHSGFAAVFGSYDDSPGAGDFTSQYKNLFHHFVHQEGREEAATFWAGCGAIRRDVFLEMGGFDADRYPRPSIEDIELGYRLRAAGHRILLNKEIQAKHLKRWTLRGIIRSDVFDRGIPWTLLILRHRSLPNDLNVTLAQRASALLLALILLHLGLSAFFHNIVILPLLGALFLLVVGHWTDAGARRMNRRAEVGAGLLAASIGGLALYLGLPWMLLPLALLLFGIAAGHRRARPGPAWTQLSFVTTVLGLTAGAALLLMSFPLWLVAPLLAMVLLLVLLNRRFYLFFARKRGAAFAVAVLPFHMLYYLYSVLAFALGTGRYYWSDGARRSA
jgi:GT2 family glycosyltransferase